MKGLFRIFSLCVLISIFLSLHVRAAGDAQVVIMVTDESGTYDGNVSIIFNFMSGPETVDFSKEEISVPSPKYVAFQNYGEIVVKAKLDSDNWGLVDLATENSLETVTLEPDGVCVLNLAIREKKAETDQKEDFDDLFNFDNVQPTEKEVKTYDVEEGYQLFKNYIEASSFLRDGSYDEWMMYNALMTMEGVHLTTNLSDEEWNALSQYEKFVYTVTYIQLAFLKASDLDAMFINPNQEGIPEDYKSMYLVCPKTDEESQKKYMNAVEEFMTWQMGYFRQNGYPYDFVRGMSYAEEVLGEIGSNKPQEESVTNNEIEEAMEVFENELSDEEKKQIVDVAKENMEKESATEVEKKSEEKGKWSEVVDKLLSMKVTLIILAVLLVALAVITIVIKKKNIDDMSSDGK